MKRLPERLRCKSTWSLPQGSNHSGMISSWGLWYHHWMCPLKVHNFMESLGNGLAGSSKLDFEGHFVLHLSLLPATLSSCHQVSSHVPPCPLQWLLMLDPEIMAQPRWLNICNCDPWLLLPLHCFFFLGICHSDGNGTELCCASYSLHCTCPPWGWWSSLYLWIITVADLSDMMNPLVLLSHFCSPCLLGLFGSPLFFSEHRPSLLLCLFLNSRPLFLRL